MAGLSVNIGANISELTNGIAQANSQLSSFVSSSSSRLQSLNGAASGIGQGIGSGMSLGISQASTSISSFASNISSFTSSISSRLQSLGDSFSSLGQKMSIGLSVPLGLLSKQVLENGGGLESLKMGLKSIEEQQYGVGKSAEYATARYNDYVQIAKLPGIGLKEAISMSIGLRSVGFSADDAKREILAFGNALALVGKGKNELNGVALQLQQLSGKAKGFGADLRVIKEYAPQVGGALLAAFGTIDTEAIAKTGVTGKQVVERITQELEKLPKAGAGIKNAMENVSDSIFNATGRIGEALNKSLGFTAIFDKIGNSLTGLATAFEGLSPTTQKFVGIVAGLLVIVPPLLIGLGAMSMGISALGGVMLVGATAIKGFVATSILGMSEFVAAVTISFAQATTAFEFFSGVLLLNPIGAIIAGIALLGGAMYGLSKIINSTTKEVSALQYAENELNAVKNANYGSFEAEISKTSALVSIIKSNVRSIEEKQSALSQLIAISPKYFQGLTIEAVKAGEADTAIKKYTDSIKENAITKGAEAKVSKLVEQLMNEKDAYDEATAKAEKYKKEFSGKQLSAGMGVFIKKGQFSNEINEEVNDAYLKYQKTNTALDKMSEFLAGRKVKVEGKLPKPDDKPKKLTEEELNAIAKGVKDTEDLLIKLAQFRADIIEDEVKKAIEGENAKYEKEKNTIQRTKADAQVKFATLQALQASHNKAVFDIQTEAKKKESEFIINSFANQVVKERALEQLSFEDKLKNVPKIIQGRANQNKAIELLEIEHQAKMREIEGRGNVSPLTPIGVKLGGIGSTLANGLDGFGKVGTLTNPIEQIANSMKNSIPKLQSTLAEVTGVFKSGREKMMLEWEQLGARGIPSIKLLTNMLKDSIPSVKNTLFSMAQTIDSGAKSMLGGFGKIIGAMAVGKAGLSDIGNMLLQEFGGIITSLGEQLIASSTLLAQAASAIALALTPAGAGLALAAGIGLVALGSAISSSSGGGQSGGGSTSYAQNYSSGSTSYGTNSAFNSSGGQRLNINIDVSGELAMRRNELVAGIRHTEKLETRTYGR